MSSIKNTFSTFRTGKNLISSYDVENFLNFSGDKNGNIVTNRDEKPEEEAKLVSESTSPATEKNEITFMKFIKTTLWPYMVR